MAEEPEITSQQIVPSIINTNLFKQKLPQLRLNAKQ
jgi:hypothetical protein